MTFEEFKKTDLRIGKVITAERVPGSEKLLKLQVDLGITDATCPPQTRQILSGIAAAYEPEHLIGKEVVIVANLEPRMLMGLESQGMLLAASDAEGKPAILTVERTVPPGTSVS